MSKRPSIRHLRDPIIQGSDEPDNMRRSLRGGVTRSERNSDRGVSAWFLKNTIAEEVKTNARLVQQMHIACGLDASIRELVGARTVGCRRDLLIDTMMDGRSARLMVSLTIDNPAFISGLAQQWETDERRLLMAAPTPDQAWRLVLAPNTYLSKIEAVEWLPHVLSFENVAEVSSERVKALLEEGCARADERLEKWGAPRVVPAWVWR